MDLFCCTTFCGTSVIYKTNLQTPIIFFKNARINKSITEKNLNKQKTRKWEKRNNPPGARPTPAQPPRPVFHLPPAPVMSATCSTPCRRRGHGCPWSPPLPHLLPPAMDPIRPTPRTPWTPPHLHSPPPRLPRFGESFPERRRRHGSELTRPVSSRRHPAVPIVSLVV